MATLVKFLISKDSDNNEVFAYFPQLKGDNKGNKTCYSHVGQHSACSPEYAKECELANEFQFSDLKTELESIGYELKVIGAPKMVWFTSGSGYVEFQLPVDVVRLCSHPGPCDDDIERCLELPEVKEALSKVDPEGLKKELYEYGAWDDKELSNHDENLKRILWIASGDIMEG